MPHIDKYVDTAAGAGGNGDVGTPWNSISEVGTYLTSKDLVTDGDTLTVYFKGGEDTSPLGINTILSSPVNWCRFEMDSSTRLTQTSLDTSKYYIHAGGAISLISGYVEVDGLQIINLGGDYTSAIRMADPAVAGEIHASNCYIFDAGSASPVERFGFYLKGGNAKGSIKNCILDSWTKRGIFRTSSSGPPGNCIAANNTLINCEIGITSNFQDIIAHNNLLTDCTTEFSTGQFESTTDYQAYEGSSGPNSGTNTHDVPSTIATYEDKAGGDYRLNASDTTLQASGIGTSNAHVLPTDFFGNSRGADNCSMGACEYVEPSSGFNPLAIFLGA